MLESPFIVYQIFLEKMNRKKVLTSQEPCLTPRLQIVWSFAFAEIQNIHSRLRWFPSFLSKASNLENITSIASYSFTKNRSTMRTLGLMLKFIPFGWNAILTYQCLEAELLQAKR